MTQSLENSKKRLINIDEYHRMVEANILGPNDRVELIRGEILHKSPISSKRNAIVNRITYFLPPAFSKKAIVQIQGPIQIGALSEPDVVICKLKEDFYLDNKPTPKDIFLLIEVSDSTLEFDKKIKLPLYAESGIPEYWIIDVNDNQILKYTLPEGNQYKKLEIIMITDSIHCHSFSEIIFLVKDILG